jgi:hypothetical protein
MLAEIPAVYLLDFDDDAPSVIRYDRKREQRIAKHPARFLEERGIIAPGYEHVPSPMRAVGLIENATPAQARRAEPAAECEFLEHPRGVLVKGLVASTITSILADELHRRGYMIIRDTRDTWFQCHIYEPDKEPTIYSPIRRDPNRTNCVDNILGRTTLADILSALEIPSELIADTPM